jgi:hypothetical protein
VTSMHFIGLDIHKKTISYCVKDVSGTVLSEGTVAATRAQLDDCDRSGSGKLILGGRARTPGLLGTYSQRIHVSFHPPELDPSQTSCLKKCGILLISFRIRR